jgi:hypothetical protein
MFFGVSSTWLTASSLFLNIILGIYQKSSLFSPSSSTARSWAVATLVEVMKHNKTNIFL